MRVENRSGLRWSVLFAMVAVRALVMDAVALERKTVTVVEERDLPSAINAVEQHWFHVPIVRLPAVVCVTVVTEPAYVSIVMGQDAGSVIIRVV